MLDRDEWLDFARKLDWEFSYVDEREVFPEAMSGRPWLPGEAWRQLVTNSLKHAFPAGRSGSILVQARTLDGERIWLCVRDDGIGLPDAVDPRQPSTLGMDLVGTLTRQLGANLSIERTGGSSFAFDFNRWKVNHAAEQ